MLLRTPEELATFIKIPLSIEILNFKIIIPNETSFEAWQKETHPFGVLAKARLCGVNQRGLDYFCALSKNNGGFVYFNSNLFGIIVIVVVGIIVTVVIFVE